MVNSYKTISTSSEGLFKDRGSKFLSFAIPVQSEKEITDHLQLLRKEYHDARHHCYAWRLGYDPPSARANDDGEPTNSAGKPILNQIEKFELTNILVVVVRYFGGTLLGVGGLINAYRTSTESALKNARITRKKIRHQYDLEFEYPAMNQVMQLVKEMQISAFDQDFGISCRMKISVDQEKEELIVNKLDLIDSCRYKRRTEDL